MSTTSRVGDPYDDANLVRMVERLYDAGETVLAGGVHFRTLADELGRPHESMRDKLAELAAEGKLDRTYGIGENGKVWTYVPVSDSKALESSVVADALEAAYAAGETAMGGDVLTETIAERVPASDSHVRKHLKRLADDGQIKRTWGYVPKKGPVKTYRPADDDQLVTDGGTVVEESGSASPTEIESYEVDLRIALRDDDVPYSAQVNDGPRFSDWTALAAVRRALDHSDDVDIPTATELSGGERDV